ncbi:DUF4105 domain-containing protein [Palleronia sp. KMU-117]|uniref:lipoprotein N-acyltransferase Lnb domain-containing protein n=1 Tax=Palleronia sp. KMU-117 TaxID=3434108 RepID=UPI003D75FB8F
MRGFLQGMARFLLALAVGYLTAWGAMALWFKLPGPDAIQWLVAAAFGALGLGTVVGIFTMARLRWLSVFALTAIVLLVWWNSLAPPSEGQWSPELARQVTGTIEGDVLTLENVRAFEWRSEEDFTEVWATRSYDISQIESVDLFMSYWGGRNMAHLMLSFGFANGDYLAWSIEVRRRSDDSFSPVADFFKAHPIAIVAAEERDVVGLRSNIQKASVRMFRLRVPPEGSRDLIEAYVAGANRLVEEPHWFNSVFTNCSRTAILLARYAGATLPADWRIIVNGYFPDYLYDQGALATDVSIEELYRLGDISERARSEGLTENYSQAIRDGVPTPRR